MSDHIAIGWNPVSEKWAVTVFIKDYDTMEAAKQAVEQMKDKIAAAFRELRDE